MHWQEKSVQFEKLVLVPAKITFISGQCDTTMVIALTWGLCAVLGDTLVFDSVNTVKFIKFMPAFVASEYRALKL